MPSLQRHVFVCVNERPADDPRGCCKAKGAVEVRDKLKAELKARGLSKLVRANNAGCLDQCARGVSVVVYPEQVWYGGVTVDDVPEIVEEHLVHGRVVERLLMPDQPHLAGRLHLPVLKTLAVLALLGGIAHADDKADPVAEHAGQEANLESNAPRQGVSLAAALGGGVLIARGTVAEIPVLSLRVGHSATPSTELLFELTGGTYVHKPAMTDTVYDQTISALVGAQVYVAPTFWLRGEGGLNIHTINNGVSTTVRAGPASELCIGIDLIVRHFWRLGLEAYGLTAINRDGLLFTSMLGISVSHY